ncbi:MAG: peptidoglycan-associated lipoprotein Pal [Kiloniellales bacterium]
MAELPEGAATGSPEDFVINVGDRVFFDTDKSELKPEARKTLERQAAWLQQFPTHTITVEGHCDERGTREYNLALGERRATAVKSYLVALGIDPNRIATISYGKERPEALGSNEAAWTQNRRGVSVLN